jgi:ketosteroid isomerase-like protein
MSGGAGVELSAAEAARVIAALRGAYGAFNRGEIDAAVAGLDPEIEWTEPVEFPGGGTYHGRDEVKKYLTQSRAGFTEGGSEPEKFIPAGNRVVVFVHAHIRLKGSDQWMDIRLADVYTIDHGRIVQMRAFAHRGEALRWVRVKDPTLQ